MAKKTKKKTQKSLYDSNGRWVEERGRIKGAIRRSFRLSPQMKEVLQAARFELPPKTLKDGSIGKKNQVRYRCAMCKNLFPQKEVQVDHIEPVVPLHKKEESMSYDDIVRGVYSNINNLQVLCSTKIKNLPKGQKSCHGRKSAQENFIRDRWAELNERNNLSETMSKNDIVAANVSYLLEYASYVRKKEKELEEKEERKRLRELNKKIKK